MPTGRQDPYTPMGEVEQVSRLASGLVALTGRRRATARLMVFLFLLFPVVFFIVVSILDAD